LALAQSSALSISGELPDDQGCHAHWRPVGHFRRKQCAILQNANIQDAVTVMKTTLLVAFLVVLVSSGIFWIFGQRGGDALCGTQRVLRGVCNRGWPAGGSLSQAGRACRRTWSGRADDRHLHRAATASGDPCGRVRSGSYVAVEETLEDSRCAELVSQDQHGMAFGWLAPVDRVEDFLSSAVLGASWTAFGSGGPSFTAAVCLPRAHGWSCDCAGNLVREWEGGTYGQSPR